jgi:hypothetical protein
VHVAPACAGSREGSDYFGSYVRNISLHFCKRLFPGLEPITPWPQGNSFTAVPGLPFGHREQVTSFFCVNESIYYTWDGSTGQVKKELVLVCGACNL